MSTEQFLKKLNIDDIEVVDEGENVMRPDVMNFLMLASIASQAVKVRKYIDDRTPNGLIQPLTVAVTDVRRRTGFPWVAQGASFINDGPNRVFLWINSASRPPHTLNVNEVFNINFEVHKLKKCFLQCDPGNTSSVRVVAQD